MKRRGVLLAVTVVLVSDAVALVQAARNRSGEPLESMQLTERELRLVRPTSESSYVVLRLEWAQGRGWKRPEDDSGWFDKSKLEELGFDCRLPTTEPSAEARYRAMGPKQVLAVLEYREDNEYDDNTRLLVVDAGLDFTSLHRKYASPGRYLIVPGLVRVRIGTNGHLRGALTELLVDDLSVPPRELAVFENLKLGSSAYFGPSNLKMHPPRYTATLFYGKNLEPWVASCRLR